MLLARNDGLIIARDNRALKSSLSRWVAQGRLIRLMRGVYAHPDAGLDARLRAVARAMPGAVIADHTALALAAEKQPTGPIEVCTPTRRAPQKGFRFTRRVIPREHVEDGKMSATLAAVDVCDKDPSWLDDLARRREATPDDYEQLLAEFSHRTGNPARRRNIARTSTSPWSMAERRCHTIFDKGHIRGWVANQQLRIGAATYIPDIAFRAEKLIIEIDGRAFHTDAATFESDRDRNNALVSAGWTILHITWAMLAHPDRIIAMVKANLARLRRAARRRL